MCIICISVLPQYVFPHMCECKRVQSTCSAMFVLTLHCRTRRGGCQLVPITKTDRLPLSHNEGAHGPPKILTKHSSPKIVLHFD